MGDLFSRLAERTLGLAPVVKPDLMAAFVTAPESTAANDSIPRAAEKAAQTSTPTKMASPREADSISQSRRAAGFENVEGDSPHSAARSWDRTVTAPGRDDREVDRELRWVNREPSTVESRAIHEKQDIVEIEQNHVSREAKTGERIPLAEIRERIHATPVIVPSKSSDAIRTATPAIQISIGRVEVRAVVQPAPTPRIVERKAPSRLSLEQYLRERNEGRR